MNIASISSQSSSYLQSILNSVLQNAGLTANRSSNASPVGLQPDNSQLSPFAQLMSMLQQVQQSDPTKYQQVTQQIATNLESAAQTATSQGNTTAANQLTQLAKDFTNASTSGQLPNIQDLAQAIGGHHHHHHHAQATSADSNGASSSSSSTSDLLSELLATFQANGDQNDALNPMSIILNTLSNAGITSSNS